MNSTGENIIDLICNSCSCDKIGTQEYLDSEFQCLHELQDADDLRESDIEFACGNPGLGLGYQEYFINRLARAQKLAVITYFQNVHSLMDLKREYRHLALQRHPDKGGNAVAMQQVNVEFEKLCDMWKDSTNTSTDTTGYEYDYSGVTAKEYAEYVHNECRWKGRNYKGQHVPEIAELVRT